MISSRQRFDPATRLILSPAFLAGAELHVLSCAPKSFLAAETFPGNFTFKILEKNDGGRHGCR